LGPWRIALVVGVARVVDRADSVDDGDAGVGLAHGLCDAALRLATLRIEALSLAVVCGGASGFVYSARSDRFRLD
jgi:hypothetical protein